MFPGKMDLENPSSESRNRTSVDLGKQTFILPEVGQEIRTPTLSGEGQEIRTPTIPGVGQDNRTPTLPGVGLENRTPSLPGVRLENRTPSGNPGYWLEPRIPSNSSSTKGGGSLNKNYSGTMQFV